MFFLVVVVLLAVGSVAQEFRDCHLPLDLGKTPCKAKKQIKYHFDSKTELCMAFEYTGCGGNSNLFDTEGECWAGCLPIDHFGCPANSAPLAKPATCQDDKECGPKGVCKFGSRFGICCDKSISEKLDSDYHPKCAKGKKVYEVVGGGIPSTLIGKTCKSNHCPKGATCVQGTYLATCCV